MEKGRIAPLFCNGSIMSWIKEYSYLGWIPCLCGRLFFDMTACGLHGKKVFAAVNHVEASRNGDIRRRILVASDVDWKDFDEDNHLLDAKEWEGTYHVALLVDCGLDDRKISGKVHLLPEHIAGAHGGWGNITSNVQEIHRLVAAREDIGALFEKVKRELEECDHHQHQVVRFTMDDAGFVALEPERETNPDDDESRFIFTRQCYYYIKYTFHRHQHHDASVDSLTTIHPVPVEDHDIGILLLEDLKHSLVELKRVTRDADYDGLVHTKGIVSYAKSLAVVSDSRGFLPPGRVDQELMLLGNLDTSLQVKVEAFNNGVQAAREKESRFHSVILLLFAMIAPVTLVFKDQIIHRLTGNDGSSVATPIVQLMANVMGGRWEAVILAVIVIGLAIRWGVWPSRRPFSPPSLMSRFRRVIDYAVHSPRKGAILWWGMMIIGMILIVSTTSWLLFGDNLLVFD